MRHLALLAAILFTSLALAQNPPAGEVVNWDFTTGDLQGWQCKSNATMKLAEEAGRGQYLEGEITYGEFNFGWFTRQHPEVDYTKVWAVEFEVRGDGQGGQLQVQLGRRGPKTTFYYINSRQALTLDFTGWRKVTVELPSFTTPAGRPRFEDLSQIYFLQFMVSGRTAGVTRLAFDNIRTIPATDQQLQLLTRQREDEAKLSAPPALDGSNLLPNSSFEPDLFAPEKPAFWQSGDWGTGSVLTYDAKVKRTGSHSVAVACTADNQRGSWSLRRSLTAGPYVFRGWVRTQGLKTEARKGPVGRLSLIGENGKTTLSPHAYGSASEGKWQLVEVKFEAPLGTTAAVVDLFNFFSPGKVWWDDVYLGADAEAIAERERRRRENEAALKEGEPMLKSAATALEQLQARAGETSDWKLLLTVLQWALEDARLAQEAKLGISLRDTCKDILDYCARADEILAAAAKTQHPAPQAPDLDANPYLVRLNAEAASLAQSCPVYKKGEEGYQQINNAWNFGSLGGQSAVMAWGLLHPRSAQFNSPALLKRLLVHLQAITQNHLKGDFNPGREAIYGADPNINRFCIAPALDALLMLQQRYPWLILPSKREEWRREFKTLVEFQYETYGPRDAFDPKRPRYYPNMDVHHLLIMELGHRLFGDDRYAKDRDVMLQWLKDALFPNGAWTYHWPQNECYGYHQLNVTFIARYYELTGDKRAREILRLSAGYYPLVHDPEGMTEHYTDCSWKHMWGAASPAGADVIAGMFDDRENKRAALDAARRGYPGSQAALYTAPWWKDLPPAPPRDNWLRYDADIVGPRGQYGKFSFAGTARYIERGSIGKDTFVGCMIGDREAKPLPLDAALQIATIESRLKPEGNHWHNARYVSGDEKATVIVTPTLSSLAVRYRVTIPRWGFGSTDEPWEGVQQWLLCGERLVGLVTLRATEDTKSAGVWGRLRFGMHKEFETGEQGMYKYGSLIARIHDHNFAKIETAPSESFYLDTPDRFRSRQILLKDAEAVSGQEPPYSYRKGQQFHYLVEVLPYWNELATGVKRIASGAVKGFELQQGGQRLVVLHNETDAVANYALRATGASVQVFSPPDKARTVPLARGQAALKIPPQSHVLVVVQP
jgi:hypothetical protein